MNNKLIISIENPRVNKYNVKVQEAFSYKYLTEDFKYNLDKLDAFKYADDLMIKYADKYNCYKCVFKY